MMRLAKQRRLLVFFILIAIILQVDIYALQDDNKGEAPDPEAAMFPSVSDMFKGGTGAPYLTNYRSNYSFDIESGGLMKNLQNMGSSIWNEFANALFTFQKSIAYLLIVVVYFSYEIDFINVASSSNPFGLGFGDLLDSLMKQLKVSIFDEVANVMILLLGVFYVAKMLRDQKTQVWTAILQTVIILALAMGYMNNPKLILKSIDGFTKDASYAILSGIYESADIRANGGSVAETACADIWTMLVHKPWQILEFGSVQLAAKNEDKLLRLQADSEERRDSVNKLAEKEGIMKPSWGVKRVGMLLLGIIPCLVKAAIIGAVCLLQLAYQFLMMLVAVFGPLVFVMALVPWWGFRALQSWAAKLIGYASMRIIAAFLTALIFTFDMWIFNLLANMKWYLVMLLQLVAIIVVIWKRDKLFDFITVVRSSQYGPGALNKQLRKDANIEGRIAERIRHERGRREDSVFEDSTIAGKGNHKRSESTGTAGGFRGSPALYNIGIGDKPEEGRQIRPDADIQHGEWQIPSESQQDMTGGSLKNLLKLAEEILERQYEASKLEAERKAEKTGNDPAYSYFVQAAMSREQMNLPRFEERQKLAVANDLKRITAAGGQVSEVYAASGDTGKPDVPERPASVVEIRLEPDQLMQAVGAAVPEEQSDRELGRILVSEFNSEYGKKYDERFMENLLRRYGRAQVRDILSRMREIQAKDGRIKNPAGYLTDALRNNARDKVGDK